MFYPKKMTVATLMILMISAMANASGVYWQEFKDLKKSKSHELMFDPLVDDNVQQIARRLENAKEVSYWHRILRPLIDIAGVAITPQSMPKLYAYIDNLCKKNGMDTPVISVSKYKGIFNAMALKLFASTGEIFIGQELLKDCDDQEIEAIIAHEIGHVYYNHSNKGLAIGFTENLIVWTALFKMHQREMITYEQCLWIWVLAPDILRPLLIGKKFERQADDFACWQADRAAGIVKLFERFQAREQHYDEGYDRLYTALNDGSSAVPDDATGLWMSYYFAKMGHDINSAYRWFYHNTPFGAHPSNEARIENAKAILAEQNSHCSNESAEKDQAEQD